jgi:hypothetical protein
LPDDTANAAKHQTVKHAPGLNGGGLNSKLHAVTDGNGKPLIFLLSEGQMSNHKGARLMLDAFFDQGFAKPIAVIAPVAGRRPGLRL